MNIFAYYIRHTLDAFRDTDRIVRHFDLIKLNGITVIFKLFFIRFFYAFSFIRNLSKPKKINPKRAMPIRIPRNPQNV